MIILETKCPHERDLFISAAAHAGQIKEIVDQYEDQPAANLALLMVCAMNVKAQSTMKKDDFIDMATRLWEGAE